MSYGHTQATIDREARLSGDRPVLRRRKPSAKNLVVLSFMCEFFAENDQLPPMQVIAKHFGFASGYSAQVHTRALITHGLLERNAVGKLRFARGRKADS